MSKKIENKIGRNSPCPCGSGDKHKRCCLPKGITFKKRESSNDKSFFDQFDKVDLLKSFAGLQVHPQNHGKNVRLELLVQEVIQSPASYGKKIVHSSSVKNYLKKYYSSHYLEDIPVNLFTELITFSGGDYIIFPGITERTTFILSNLLNAIFHLPGNNIPNEFKAVVYQASTLILAISDTIGKRLGYGRYIKEEILKKEIELPSNADFEPLKKAVSFSIEEIENIRTRYGIAEEVIFDFVSDNDILKEIDPNNNPLEFQPLVFERGSFIVLSPTTITHALTHFIWSVADTMGCMAQVNSAFHSVLWRNTQMTLNLSGFKLIQYDDFPVLNTPNIREGIFQFDDDKLAYVVYQFDDGQNYTNSNHSPSVNPMSVSDAIDERKQQVVDYLLAKEENQEFSILNINLFSGIGRDMALFFGAINNAVILGFSTHELDVLFKTGELRKLDLWYFALTIQSRPFGMMNFSTLDQYAFYKDHDQSLYVSDESKATGIFLTPGYSEEFIKNAVRKQDYHSVRKTINGNEVFIPVWRKDEYAPIYFHPGDLGIKLDEVVIGFPQPIWVQPVVDIQTVPPVNRGMYLEMNEAIAFWLWQVCDNLSPFLKKIDNAPITILFEFDDPSKFINIERQPEKTPNLFDKFQRTIDGNRITIVIPSEIIEYLHSSDNEGERVLLEFLLHSINAFLQNKGVIDIMIDEEIKRIVDEDAPLGVKKKIFILDTSNNLLLDPTNLKGYRYVQEYQVNVILDSLVTELGNRCPDLGDVTTKEEKTQLTRNIVMRVLFPKLIQTIQQYSSEKLLKRLISLNENLIQKREELRIKTPTRIACFVSEEEQVSDLMEILGKLNRTTLATRCLIEHLASDPHEGTKIISTSGIDELIAIMDQAISWAFLGDQIEYDLFDVKIGVLPSGRIGRDKKTNREVFDPYNISKTKESIQNAKETFIQAFPVSREKSKDVPENLDQAFHDEFGISFTRICEFINDLGLIAYNQDSSCACLSKAELVVKINTFDHMFSGEEIEAAISNLTLLDRGGAQNIPEGYDNYDVSPWRFNRRLSLLRKPLVAVPNQGVPDNPTFYWGFRQLLATRMYLQEQCTSGRLKVVDEGAVNKVLSKLANQRGTTLVNDVLEQFDSENLIIDSELFIGPNKELKHERDIGDIDVFILDKAEKVIYSLECKSLAPSRNIKEMAMEVERLFGSESNKGLIQKHVERDEWIKGNKDQLSAKYDIDLSGFSVKSFMCTQEDMLTPYLNNRESALPFVTLYSLKKDGFNALK